MKLNGKVTVVMVVQVSEKPSCALCERRGKCRNRRTKRSGSIYAVDGVMGAN